MMPTHDSGKNFAIAVDLLSDHQPLLPWANLGDWTTTSDYTQACRQLAWRVGHAAALQAGDHVLDMACGHGASLALWPEAFGAHRVSALELQTACIENIRQHPPQGLAALAQGRFDTLPAPAVLTPSSFDAAVCVDAAYHAASLEAFASFAAHLLRPQGRLAFTTLVLPDAPAHQQQMNKTLLRVVLAQAGIPAASLQSLGAITDILSRQGFAALTIEKMDTAVLHGFHTFVQRRRNELSWKRKVSADWLKIVASAWLCENVYESGALHYCLISATRR